MFLLETLGTLSAPRLLVASTRLHFVLWIGYPKSYGYAQVHRPSAPTRHPHRRQRGRNLWRYGWPPFKLYCTIIRRKGHPVEVRHVITFQYVLSILVFHASNRYVLHAQYRGLPSPHFLQFELTRPCSIYYNIMDQRQTRIYSIFCRFYWSYHNHFKLLESETLSTIRVTFAVI
jgi:hypothetical protein